MIDIGTKYPSVMDKPYYMPETSAWGMHTPIAFFLVAAMKPRLVVELGVFSGCSYFAFCQAVQRMELINSRVVGVDTWKGDINIGSLSNDSVYEDVKAKNDLTFRGVGELMRTTFDEAVTSFMDGEIDILHIDGAHTYEDVRHDFETWLPKLAPGGIILFHDIHVEKENFGVKKFWGELKELYEGRTFEVEHCCGLGLLVPGPRVNEDVMEIVHDEDNHANYQEYFFVLGSIYGTNTEA